MKYRDLTFERIEKSLIHNKDAGHDDIDSNVIIKVYHEISYPLFMIFYSLFNKGIFPELLKVSNIFPIFKAGNIEDVELNIFPKTICLSTK